MPLIWPKNKTRNPTQRENYLLDCIERWLCLYSEQELPTAGCCTLSTGGIIFIVTKAVIWHSHPRAIPSFALPLAAPEYTDLGAHHNPMYSQQAVSQAKWWWPNIQADQNWATLSVISPCKPVPWKAVLFPLRLLSSIFMKYEVNYLWWYQTVLGVFFSWK